MRLVLAKEQNHYPDMSFVASDGLKFAVDLKSAYRKQGDKCNTMTLGSYWGYFRNRSETGQITYPYGDYAGHFVLGVVYDRAMVKASEMIVHTVEELRSTLPLDEASALQDIEYTHSSLAEIPAVVRGLQFFAQPKYRIAKDITGSGNTRNIGAVNNLSQLINGTGPFASLGEEIFDDYWMIFFNKADAKATGLPRQQYANIKEYINYRTLRANPEAIDRAIVESASNSDNDAADTEEL